MIYLISFMYPQMYFNYNFITGDKTFYLHELVQDCELHLPAPPVIPRVSIEVHVASQH